MEAKYKMEYEEGIHYIADTYGLANRQGRSHDLQIARERAKRRCMIS